MRGRTESCVISLYQTDSYFIKIPEKWTSEFTLKRNNVTITKLSINNQTFFFSVGGVTQKPDTIEVGPVHNLDQGPAYIERPEDHEVGLAEMVSVAPVSQADWEIIKFNQSGVQQAILTKIRAIQMNSIFSIFLNSLKLRLKVTRQVPAKSCLVLQEMTEMEIMSLDDSDEELEISSSDEEVETENHDSLNPGIYESTDPLRSIFNFFKTPVTPSYEMKEFSQLFLNTPFEEILTTAPDESLLIPSVCKISDQHLQRQDPFFAKLIYKDAQKEDKSWEFKMLYVKCVIDKNVSRNRLLLSKSLFQTKKIRVNERVLLESLDLKAHTDNIVSQVEIETNNTEMLSTLKSKLESDFNILEDGSQIVVDNISAGVRCKNGAKFVFTKPNCDLLQVSDHDKSSVPVVKSSANINSLQSLVHIHEKEFDDCIEFCKTSLGIENPSRKPFHCLVTGIPGVGKSTFSQQVVQTLERKINVHHAFMNCSLLKGKRADVVKKKVLEELNTLERFKPSILVLDNLESIFGVKDDDSADDTSCNLSKWLAKRMKCITENSTGICIMAICESVESLNINLQPQNGNNPFEKVVQLMPPTVSDKEKLIRHFLGKVPDDWNLKELDEYLPCDIKLICDRINASEKYECSAEILKSHTPVTHWGKSLKSQLKKDLGKVGGMLEAKDVLQKTILWQIKYRDIFQSVGVRMPKGVLLYGAPGTGKTMLAEALASSSQINFLPVKGPELLSKYIGASERNVRDLFLKAQSAKPCIIFFDEFDSLAPKRGHDSTGVTDRVVNQLLTQMDGVEGLDGVWIIATTSRPDLIDGALLRPGRIDKSVLCPIPSRQDREDILRKLCSEYSLHDDVDLAEIAELTEGFTGADLKSLLYTAKQSSKAGIKEFESKWSKTVITIKHVDLVAACKSTKTSVSQNEAFRLHNIYTQFKTGKLSAQVSQRATLA